MVFVSLRFPRLDRARHFAREIQAAGYQILNDVVLNQVLVSFGDAETTLRAIAEIQADGTCWCSSTVWQGQTAMRIIEPHHELLARGFWLGI
ncbi:hypothetical protein WA1_42795 [Scytonema hofmannii PCC 7110]|uniref:Uncharacterized protein n=1 Tax=Scytonema hofmannii PCC 7110 TaxID=128403 RepID=A0A139WVH6_9CYAN|nr:hypothetical protein [Scytonema hofmannii]KYC36438.1 hypothetical protein WA1_42795 [Scytonema hofmannii PCC 7110]